MTKQKFLFRMVGLGGTGPWAPAKGIRYLLCRWFARRHIRDVRIEYRQAGILE